MGTSNKNALTYQTVFVKGNPFKYYKMVPSREKNLAVFTLYQTTTSWTEQNRRHKYHMFFK